MALALSGILVERREPTLRFLRAAVALDRLDVAAVVDAGVPRWDADDCLRRLERSGEVREGAWTADARVAYARLALPPDADASAGDMPQRALDRLAEGDRPREKALRGGIDSLDDAELIALLLRTGGDEGVVALAQRLLNDHGGLAGLARREVDELIQDNGLGPAKAAELAAAFAIGRRLASADLRTRPLLALPEAVASLLAPLMNALPHEELWCLALDRHNRLIGAPRVVTKGDVDGTDAGPRAFFRHALASGASTAIAAHNHPSGDPTPSASDRAVTVRLVAAGRTVDLPLVDHVVVGSAGRYVSLRRACPECFR